MKEPSSSSRLCFFYEQRGKSGKTEGTVWSDGQDWGVSEEEGEAPIEEF